jgi:1-aminocyclopropane-1-carboxylate deaminase/D-cysteine desulfhydrase-like pyridoxal-dependent ACC family enzyme
MGDSVNLLTGKRGQSGLDYLTRNTNLGEDTIMGQQRKVLEANARARKLEREKKKKAEAAARGVAKATNVPSAIPTSGTPSALDYLSRK